MSLHNPPFYRYTLSEQWSRNAYMQIKAIGSSKNFPKIKGTPEEKNLFLITLIRTQKALHEWENLLIDVMHQVTDMNAIDVAIINAKYPPSSVGKDVPAWVTYSEDKIVSDFIDELETRKLKFVGTDVEMSEFILRFILGQIGHDWEQTIIMIWEMLGDGTYLNLSDLNRELKGFDYSNLFI